MAAEYASPWDRRARELEAEHGPWAYYAAWKEWMNERMYEPCLWGKNGQPCNNCFSCTVAVEWDAVDTMLEIAVFNAMCDALPPVNSAIEVREPGNSVLREN